MSCCGRERALLEISCDQITAEDSDHADVFGEMVSGNALTFSHAGVS
jgi:hypothetical protein